jgi:propanediol utilization protein
MSIDERIDELEFKMSKLYEIIVDPKRTHFNHVIMDYSLSRNEVNKIFGLMDEITTKTDLKNPDAFRAEVGKLVPRLKEERHFVEATVRALYEDGRYQEVFKRFYER